MRLVLCIVILVVVLNTANAIELFETFDNDDIFANNKWEVVDEPDNLLGDKGPSVWEVKSSQHFEGRSLYQTSNIWGDANDVGALGTFLIYNDEQLTNLTLEYDIYNNDEDGWGCVWRWKSRTKHYRFLTVLDNVGSWGSFQRLEKRLGDEPPYYKALDKNDNSYTQFVKIHLKLEVKDDTFKVYMNDKKILEGRDTELDRGKIGIALYAQQGVEIDNLKVTGEDLSLALGGKLTTTWGELKRVE
jgi:hypothetical protein